MLKKNKENKFKIIIIAGPTASGKSSLALELGKKYKGIIINADSQQIYKELPILSCQPNKKDYKIISHKLFNFLDFYKNFSVNQWFKLVTKEIKEAMKELVEANLRFVVSVAKKYQGNGLSLSDIINEGNLGLIKAAKRFDPSRGFKFISYAVWWIRQAILQALAEQGRLIRLPLNRVGTITKITKAAEKLEAEIGRQPKVEEISHQLDIKTNEVFNALQYSRRHSSLDAPFSDGEDSSLINVIEDEQEKDPDNKVMDTSMKEEIASALSTLTDRERSVIEMYFGINRDRSFTLNEIGEQFNLTRERVRQIKEKAIRRLAHKTRSEPLRVYLGQ